MATFRIYDTKTGKCLGVYDGADANEAKKALNADHRHLRSGHPYEELDAQQIAGETTAADMHDLREELRAQYAADYLNPSIGRCSQALYGDAEAWEEMQPFALALRKRLEESRRLAALIVTNQTRKPTRGGDRC